MLININKYFTIIFGVEMFIKILGLGIHEYVKDEFNLFDAILVVISYVDLVIESISNGGSGAKVVTVFRTLRLMKIFKLATKNEGLLVLLKAIKETLVDIAYFSILLLLYIFICGLVGMDLFAYYVRIDNLDDENPIDRS